MPTVSTLLQRPPLSPMANVCSCKLWENGPTHGQAERRGWTKRSVRIQKCSEHKCTFTWKYFSCVIRSVFSVILVLNSISFYHKTAAITKHVRILKAHYITLHTVHRLSAFYSLWNSDLYFPPQFSCESVDALKKTTGDGRFGENHKFVSSLFSWSNTTKWAHSGDVTADRTEASIIHVFIRWTNTSRLLSDR